MGGTRRLSWDARQPLDEKLLSLVVCQLFWLVECNLNG